jgi:cyclophilin family peptidyl-prolyl cis-trans isomerase
MTPPPTHWNTLCSYNWIIHRRTRRHCTDVEKMMIKLGWIRMALSVFLIILVICGTVRGTAYIQQQQQQQQRQPLPHNRRHYQRPALNQQQHWYSTSSSTTNHTDSITPIEAVLSSSSSSSSSSSIHDPNGRPKMHTSITNHHHEASRSRRRILLRYLPSAGLFCTAIPTTLAKNTIPIAAAAATTNTAVASTTVWSSSSSLSVATKASSTTAAKTLQSKYTSPHNAKVTQRVFFNVRISRSDGTFYVRDDDDSNDPNNQVYQGQLVFALFGETAPHHVQQFLQYVVDPTTTTGSSNNSRGTTTNFMEDERENEATPYPSYSRSAFTRYDDGTGVLYGGTIPSLEVTEIQQSVVLRYGNRLLPAPLWIEESTGDGDTSTKQISHCAVGLLTHRQLDATPTFGITTRADTTSLNPTHTVFGQLVMNPTAVDFLRRVTTLPTYSEDGPILSSPPSSLPAAALPSSSISVSSPQLFMDATQDDEEFNTIFTTSKDRLYNYQRAFFRTTAKTLGDTRLNKLYDGKILRRIEVTQVGLL